MYTLLIGAKKNAGDFFIADRGRHLLKSLRKETDFLEFKRWEPLDERLAEVNETKAVILCGGPGYRTDFYPGTFALARDINDIKVPIIPYGLGWSGKPMYQPESFHFSDESRVLLQHIHERCEATSCRDNMTKEILNRHGFRNVIMTGCPTWYDLDSIGRGFERPTDIRRVAVSMTQPPAFVKQNMELLRKLKDLVKRVNPRVELWAVFHRGIAQDEFTPPAEAAYLQSLLEHAEGEGYRVADASYNASDMEIYRTCDFHAGFRVHAHIYFLSIRKPSFLLQVDGRGRGLSETLGLPDIPLESRPSKSSLSRSMKSRLPAGWRRALGRVAVARHVDRQVDRALAGPKPNAVTTLMNDVEGQLGNGFQRFQGVDAVIDSYFEDMVRFLKTLP